MEQRMMEGSQEQLTLLVAASSSFEIICKELRGHTILWGKGETKAEIYPAKARTHKSVGKHPGIQWCLLFPEYFLINSLFTTKHAWSNWTYLLSIFSSVLQTGSKKKQTKNQSTNPIVFFPDSLVGCNGTFLLIALQMVQILKPTSPRQAHRFVEGPPRSQTRTQLKSSLPKQNPDTLGQRLPNKGKKISLHCLGKKQVGAKHMFPNAHVPGYQSILSQACQQHFFPPAWIQLFPWHKGADSCSPSHTSAGQKIEATTQAQELTEALISQGHHCSLQSHN